MIYSGRINHIIIEFILKENYRMYQNVEKLEDGVNRQFTIDLCSIGVYHGFKILLVTIHMFS